MAYSKKASSLCSSAWAALVADSFLITIGDLDGIEALGATMLEVGWSTFDVYVGFVRPLRGIEPKSTRESSVVNGRFCFSLAVERGECPC